MIEVQRELLNTLIKQVKKRIKEVQVEKKDAYSQEDVWIKQGVENELISWKISLEKWRKKLKYKDTNKINSLKTKVIISLLNIESIDNKSKDGYVNIGKWTKKEGGTFSIYESNKPIFEILDSKELFYLMKGDKIEIEKDRFDILFFDNTHRESVECADCELVHYKDERVKKVENFWTTYHCPNCNSESTCKV